MGSPDFATQILSALAIQNFDSRCFYTTRSRIRDAEKYLTPPPVKTTAVQLNIPVFQPPRLKAPEVFADLATLNPDVIVVAAYGQILRQNVLDLPKFGCINVHASYLPSWRGAAPIQAAILAGDEFTGVSIMKMDAGIDTGAVLAKKKVNIDRDETAITLERKLANVGSDLLLETLPKYLIGEVTPEPQSDEGSTYAGVLNKLDGVLDFSRPAVELERKIRAFDDWPGTYIMLNEQILKIRKARVVQKSEFAVSERGIIDGMPAFGTGEGALVLVEVQPAGKKWMSGVDFLRGYQKTWLTG